MQFFRTISRGFSSNWPCESTREGAHAEGVGSERTSSRRTQIAKPNRGARERGQRDGGQCCARPPDEHAIWRSEMSLNGGRRGHGRRRMSPDMSLLALKKIPQHSQHQGGRREHVSIGLKKNSPAFSTPRGSQGTCLYWP